MIPFIEEEYKCYATNGIKRVHGSCEHSYNMYTSVYVHLVTYVQVHMLSCVCVCVCVCVCPILPVRLGDVWGDYSLGD